jgi:hypothetical protein
MCVFDSIDEDFYAYADVLDYYDDDAYLVDELA